MSGMMEEGVHLSAGAARRESRRLRGPCLLLIHRRLNLRGADRIVVPGQGSFGVYFGAGEVF